MTSRAISFFREHVSPLFRINSTDDPPLSPEFPRELYDCRKFSLNLLMAFLAVHTISASNVLEAMTLALFVYTITLHITVHTSFLQYSPTLSRFLHAIPLFGIFCMAVFELVSVLKSPAVAAAVLLACALPPVIITVHLARRYAEMISMPFPVQMRKTASAGPGAANTMMVSS